MHLLCFVFIEHSFVIVHNSWNQKKIEKRHIDVAAVGRSYIRKALDDVLMHIQLHKLSISLVYSIWMCVLCYMFCELI